MNPVLVTILRAALDDWRREAKGSRQSAEHYEQMAAEHRSDEERAETRAAAIESALREAGIDPDEEAGV